MTSRPVLELAYLVRRDCGDDIQPALKDACRCTAKALLTRFKGASK